MTTEQSFAETLRVFIDLLRREQAALIKGDIEALAALIPEKSALAERLNGISPAEAEALRGLATEARELNETNGKLIALHLQRNQQALNVLRAAADNATVYGRDGQPRQGGVSHSLGKA
ncbi:flagella synthesis protein FlgN [Sulfuricystis multivorans]|uniref:flagella synthesis protein FlgN n=1 Tax=Sulfuricystis multivorans TaxID=2211108 RepID=UPI000F835E2B|nr:flagellar protein FlgN [Sulfuricystis multivorans]